MNFTKEQMLDEILYYRKGEELNIEYLSKITLEDVTELFLKTISENKEFIPIKQLLDKNQDKTVLINTPDGFQEIGDFWYKTERFIFEIKTKNHNIKCSSDHLIETNIGWIEAAHLILGNKILTISGYEEIIDIKHNKAENVYDFEVIHDNHRYWGGSGISSHNTGKTFLALNAAREAQKKGYYIVWIDTENAVDTDMMERFGIDSEKVNYQPIDDLSTATTILRNIADKLLVQIRAGGDIPKILVVLDSLGNLSTFKEKNDTLSGSDKKDMTRASEIRKLFRVMIRDFGVLKIPCIITNHTHKDIGSFITQDTIGGGGGAEYNPSVTLMLSKAQLKEDNVNKTGIVVTSKLKKSRFTKEIPIKFHISFIKGMNPYVGLEKYVEYDICGVGAGKLVDGKYIFDDSENPKYYAIKHLNKNIRARELWTSEIFTDDVLDALDVKIRLAFEFPDPVKAQLEEIDEIMNINKETGEVFEEDDEFETIDVSPILIKS